MNTRSRALVARNESKIRLHSEKFQMAWQARLRLVGGDKSKVGWPQLKKEDIRCMQDPEEHSRNAEKRRKATERRLRKESELREDGLLGEEEDDEMVTPLRIEWSKAWARSRRWTEEVRLLEEEWRRLPVTHAHREKVWIERAVAVPVGSIPFAEAEGMVAYATKQSQMYRDLAIFTNAGAAAHARHGSQFSPWENFQSLAPSSLTASGFQVHRTSFSLEELLAAAEHTAEVRAQAEAPDDDSDWQDLDVLSSDLEDSDHHSRPPSPDPHDPIASPDSFDHSQPCSSSPLPHNGKPPGRPNTTSVARQKKRQENAASPFTRIPHPKSMPAHRMLPSRKTDTDARDFETSNGGHWLGKRASPPGKSKQPRRSKKKKVSPRRHPNERLRDLKELTEELGYQYISWDGRNPLLILDREGRIIVVFVGAPEDADWPFVVGQAAEAFEEAREEGLRTGAFAVGEDSHRRGRFWTLKGGVSHGGGQKRPGNMVNPPGQLRLFNRLIANKYVRRIGGFQSSAMRTFGPKLFQDYVNDLQALFAHHPELRHNFTNSILPAVTFNLGPQSVTFEHVRRPQQSARLLVVEFPPAATTLLPSAVIAHGNTPLSPSETWFSMTQYAAGGLFRYVKYGFKTTKQLLAQGGRSLKGKLDGNPGQRHNNGLDLFSKADELARDHAACFGV
ncbi:hypothetical protein MSAN_02036500 [Mycena sanguinolenta]|uniref:Uncharacterized protein n=1 Tax=Mycena sanguinolenta TaxID=230812 RepID=A0A8H7CLA0_9AGAR|nr:hypothetical protein MSAN_02036500 [Mycena sanguinolenta]